MTHEKPIKYRVVNARECRDLIALAKEITAPAWPEFMMHDEIAVHNWSNMYEAFPEYQFAMIEEGSDRILAIGNSVPLEWKRMIKELPDGGFDWALSQSLIDYRSGKTATIQSALQIVIAGEFLGRSLSGETVKTMIAIGRAHNLRKLVAPVRPNHKEQFPLIPMERYIEWQNDDNLPYDPWMRVHVRLGARILKVCRESMRIEGTVADWQKWTGMSFPDSGQYLISGALVPVQIDCQFDRGVYLEPNVWMSHTI